MYYLRNTAQRLFYQKKYPKIVLSEEDKTNSEVLPVESIIKKETFLTNLSEWVSGSSVRAYLLKDPILDWLNEHSQYVANKYPQYTELINKAVNREPDELNFTEFIMKKGRLFEEKVDDLIKDKFQNDFIDIKGNHDTVASIDKFEETKKAIADNIPIIISGVLHNHSNKTYGVPDLIVRSDYLSKMFSEPPLLDESLGIHYVICDVKWTTLKLTCDARHLLNSGAIPAYKSQVFIYTDALSKITKTSPCAYILGRRWSYTSEGRKYKGTSCFEKLGVIDFADRDFIYTGLTTVAIDWVKDCRKNGDKWTINQISLGVDLRPNLCNAYDYPWTKVKQAIAEDSHDITQLWMCGPKQREVALINGVTNWLDPRCTLEALGIKSPVKSNVVGKMLEINQSTTSKFEVKTTNTSLNKNPPRFFVDFETINDVILDDFSDLPHSYPRNIIFQIGVYRYSQSEGAKYFVFNVNELTEAEEKRICQEFWTFLKRTTSNTPRVCHWSHAEETSWRKACEKHHLYLDIEWIDVLKIFKEQPIVMKGVFDFSLKSVANAMHKAGLIEAQWDSVCLSGTEAMLAVFLAQQEINELKEKSPQMNLTLSNSPRLRDLERYNKIDCQSLYEIVQHLIAGRHEEKCQVREEAVDVNRRAISVK